LPYFFQKYHHLGEGAGKNLYYLSCTLSKKDIKDDGGIPGFEELADAILIFPDNSDSCARFKAATV